MKRTHFQSIRLLLKEKTSHKHLLLALALLIIFIGAAPSLVHAQQFPLNQKKLETKNGKKKDNRKRFTRKKKVDNRDVKVDVRYSKKRRRPKDKKVSVRSISRRNEKAKDNRNLSSPGVEENQHTFDFKKRNQLRPYRPEKNYEGFINVGENNNPSKEATSFSGNYRVTTGREHKGPKYTGDFKAPSPKRQDRSYQKLSKERHQYEGDIKVSSDKKPKAPSYRGDFKTSSPNRQARSYQKLSKERHQYEGDIKISSNKKPNAPSYSGNIKMPTFKAKQRHFKKLSKERHQYEGDFRIKRTNKRDLHPSSEYRGGKRKNSRKQKERLRKRKLWWFRWFKGNSDQPDHLKEKPEKPKYDSRESEIWYD